MPTEDRRRQLREGQRRRILRKPLYNAWQLMKQRCLNPCDRAYADYGGRGIRVCARWAESYEAFAEDMGPKPSPQHSLDRYPDKNGHYEPGNCRWATPSEQAFNRRPKQPRKRPTPDVSISGVLGFGA